MSRWGSVWQVKPDRTRHFLPKPPADCHARATPIEEGLSSFTQAKGGGKGYALEPPLVAAACAALDGCLLPGGVSAFQPGQLHLMHAGVAADCASAPPPTVVGARRGGTDAANAATWRLATPRWALRWAAAAGGAAAAATAAGRRQRRVGYVEPTSLAM